VNKEALAQITEKYWERATTAEFERSLYTRDLAPVPALLVNPLFKTLPDIVVRPANTEEVADIMKIADQHHIPVTPRAGASTVYFDTVPTRSGILMDLNLIAGIVNLDREAMTVRVKAATTWSELDDYLNRQGLACKSFPSSAPAATIGGWFCMMGYGIGSLKYGSLLSQIRAIEVVMPDGSIKELTRHSNPPLDWFASSEGTVGVVTELVLEIRNMNGMKHYILQLANNHEIAKTLYSLIHKPVIPYNIHFSDQECLRIMRRMGFFPANINSGCVVGVDYEGDEEELAATREIIDSLHAGNKFVNPVAGETAELEWEERFKALKLKRGGPSVLGAEIWLPIGKLDEYLNDVQSMSRAYDLPLISYGHVVTPEYATVMTMFYADETYTLRYIINLSLVKKIHDIGYRHGGHPYGIGLWNTPYVKRIYKNGQLEELRQRKKLLDRRGIMNPGKVYRAPLMLNPLNFTIGMNTLAILRKLMGKGW
jgi:glycolate oxidase